ncbi:hypothetical protein C1646_771361 [Rhizophagus diaphanus]|nr:hypothetical protein C1646_771361 [Rhizophagus diaphanus] [Rhizophagus sp. MUCL 43196]
MRKLSRYQVQYHIKSNRETTKRNNMKLNVEIQIQELDNVKAYLHGIIVMIIMAKINVHIVIKAGKSLIDLVINYIKEDSDRKKLNHRYYVELTFICHLIREKDLSIEWRNITAEEVDDDPMIVEVDSIMKLKLVDLPFNIYILRWKKNERLLIEDSPTQQITTYGRTKLRILLKLLPAYTLLFERGSDHVITDLFPRCELKVEDWEHIWSCHDNEKSEYDVLIGTFVEMEEKYKNQGDEEKFKTVRTLVKDIMTFMMTPSKVLILGDQLRIRELTRGRDTNRIEELCPRCEKFNEDWEHIWICKANEVENFKTPIKGKNRYWDLGINTRDIQPNFNKIAKGKEYKKAIENLWLRAKDNKKGFKEKESKSREESSGEELELEGKNNNLKQRKTDENDKNEKKIN